jgi:hypothetical protein
MVPVVHTDAGSIRLADLRDLARATYRHAHDHSDRDHSPSDHATPDSPTNRDPDQDTSPANADANRSADADANAATHETAIVRRARSAAGLPHSEADSDAHTHAD